MFIVGCDPGTVYTKADTTTGKFPALGTRATVPSATGAKEFIACRVGSSQNLVTGMVVNINASFITTVISLSSEAPGRRQIVGVAVVTATASLSAGIWVQVWGHCNVIASTSCNPNVYLVPAALAANAGGVDDATPSSLSNYLEGIITLASTNATATLVDAWLSYPRWASFQ